MCGGVDAASFAHALKRDVGFRKLLLYEFKANALEFMRCRCVHDGAEVFFQKSS